MSTIVKRLNKLVSAWGGKGDAHTIEDALENLSNNPPFGTKTEMVEIVPLQSVTQNAEFAGDTSYYTEAPAECDFVVGKTYAINLNGTKYMAECVGDINDEVLLSVDDDNYVCYYKSTYDPITGETIYNLGVNWAKSLGETIALAIYEEQEVVKPLDPKFVGAFKIAVAVTNDGITCNKTYNEIAEQISGGNHICCYGTMYDGMAEIVTSSVSKYGDVIAIIGHIYNGSDVSTAVIAIDENNNVTMISAAAPQ